MVSEIAPLMIMTKLEQYQYAESYCDSCGDAACFLRFDAAYQWSSVMDSASPEDSIMTPTRLPQASPAPCY